MSTNKRVVWSEGLFLRPQHFQQHDRFLERYVQLRAESLRPHGWGFTELELERDLLGIGKLAIRRAVGVYPDGTPFAMPDDDPLPPALEVSADARAVPTYLAIPLRRAGSAEVVRNPAAGLLARFAVAQEDARDATADTASMATLEVGALQSRILLHGQALADFAAIPLAQIVECRADRKVILDEGFMPSGLRSAAVGPLAVFLKELQGLLHHRGEELARRVSATGRGGAAEIADFLLLQLCNRYEPVVAHWGESAAVHPEDFYLACVSLAGELATLVSEKRRPPVFAPYEHGQLQKSFAPVIAELRASLGMVLHQSAVPIPLKPKPEYALWSGTIADKSLLKNASFVLAVRAETAEDNIRRYLPMTAKIATVERIGDFVRQQLPGIALSPLPQVPRQIPFHAGFVYFMLDGKSAVWDELATAGGIAIHVAGQLPKVELELWAIRQ